MVVWFTYTASSTNVLNAIVAFGHNDAIELFFFFLQLSMVFIIALQFSACVCCRVCVTARLSLCVCRHVFITGVTAHKLLITDMKKKQNSLDTSEALVIEPLLKWE